MPLPNQSQPPILKAPFPYFGGKRTIANLVWQAFGQDVGNYVEPFAGSLAVLLSRRLPENQNIIETVNDANFYLANFWRATQHDPEQVAAWADWPVNECDLHARHRWLSDLQSNTVAQKADNFVYQMKNNPDYYDPKVAGWWVWGISAWIGSGWCKIKGDSDSDTEQVLRQQIPQLRNAGSGVHRTTLRQKIPHLGNAGKGVHRTNLSLSKRRPHLGDAGNGVNRPTTKNNLIEYFGQLKSRLRNVRVCCGDWSRIMGPSVTGLTASNAVFLDPPYVTGADYYAFDPDKNAKPVALEVLEWCKQNWDNPKLRIVLCGFERELDVPEAWRKVAWKGPGGYGQNTNNASLERLWLSPACLVTDLESPKVKTLWD